jgi:hypothetical protein
MKKFIVALILFTSFVFGLKSKASEYEALIISSESNVIQDEQTQDTIFQRKGEIIICKVKEIGISEVKYVRKDYNPDLLFSISKNDIVKIVYADGKVQIFEIQSELAGNIEQNSQDLFQIQKKNAIKFDFISLVNNTFCLTYEGCLKPARTLEFSIGVVGIGFAEKKDMASGILFRGGYKLIRSPDYYLKGMRYAHIMKGPYLKFEFDFASYGIEGYKDLFESKEKYTLTKWALLMVFGNQWVFNDAFVVDLYSGIGIGKNNLEDLDWTYPYGFTTLGNGFPMALSFGVRCGFLFNGKQK